MHDDAIRLSALKSFRIYTIEADIDELLQILELDLDYKVFDLLRNGEISVEEKDNCLCILADLSSLDFEKLTTVVSALL